MSMWSPDRITVEIVDADHPVLEVVVTTPIGAMSQVASASIVGRVLRLDGVHVGGLAPGTLGEPASTPLAGNYWKSPMSTKSSFRAALERRGSTRAKSPVRSGFPIPLVLALDDVKQPVEVGGC